ncbi:protein KINASE OF THE OUTER CHLOROPLAST MEMBRANE 1 isoform X2 [Humulus lupulus]|uniref:protein KINASE OF THE OUTER CHLOROPLAST MEMBRANE 1 isoform X2 n=1 Tax=Humulus lupulus TaxID=3486 RepID=UPI002B413FBA|nr:protein KINASE OF THE OUTER CHLOROPLAST MEMBRANE 1 isoform X2 [Humulus lupulus]
MIKSIKALVLLHRYRTRLFIFLSSQSKLRFSLSDFKHRFLYQEMAKQVSAVQRNDSFEFELFEDDTDHLKTVVASSSQISPRILPAKLKLRQRIGRGTFGDVWLATHLRSAGDYEVAVKMLPLIKEEHMKVLLDKFDCLFSKCQALEGVCSIYGISVIGGKICIVMKFYEGSAGDKLAHLKEGKFSVADVLRYGIDLAQGILELHSKGILILNLKLSNVLLDENDQAILGDFGIPYLLLGSLFPSSDMAFRLGTPNYMAPEQWQPEVRGPISFETDSWGFGCCIVEMLTGAHPWHGRSIDEIYHLVVKKHEKPQIPSGLPPAVENVLLGCFEYDLRNRPLISDILHVFKSSQSTIFGDGGRPNPWSGTVIERSNSTGFSTWFLLKDRLQVGDAVRSRKSPNSCKPENMTVPDGTVVGLERDTEHGGFVLVRVRGIHDPQRVCVKTLERVTFGLAAGDWVRLKEEDKKHSPVGILHSINRDSKVAVGFIGMETLWEGNSSEFEMAESYCVGQFVKLKSNVISPRFEWPRKRGGAWATGRIWWILPNGCLKVKFPGILTFKDECSTFLADPAEVELVTLNTCPGVVKKYQHLEDFHWTVRPLLIALGLFAAMKLGIFVGHKMGRSKVKKQQSNDIQRESHYVDGQNAGHSGWIPPKVANMLFREKALPQLQVGSL